MKYVLSLFNKHKNWGTEKFNDFLSHKVGVLEQAFKHRHEGPDSGLFHNALCSLSDMHAPYDSKQWMLKVTEDTEKEKSIILSVTKSLLHTTP